MTQNKNSLTMEYCKYAVLVTFFLINEYKTLQGVISKTFNNKNMNNPSLKNVQNTIKG